MTGGRAGIGGLVLAGGRGLRMGGADKGLLPWLDGTLAAHAVARLALQVAAVAISANRNLDAYDRLGVPVVRDVVPADSSDPPFDGPLAGVLAALDASGVLQDLPWLAVVPCDVPNFPPDLVARLLAASGDAPAAHAVSFDPITRQPQEQPLCCLISRDQRPALAAYLASGRRSARGFLAGLGAVAVPFDRPGDDPHAFVNGNAPGTLAALKGPAKLPADPAEPTR